MAFHEIQFPPLISYGAVGGPTFHTTVLTLANGFEQRNIDWASARAVYDVSQGLKTQADLDQLLNFFYARQGKANGFRFKDWTDYQVPAPGYAPQPLGLTNGKQFNWQIVKTYGDAASTYTRPIYKPIISTFQLYDNGALATNWVIDSLLGVLTTGPDINTSTGHELTCTCEFDVPVRFDTDEMKVTIEQYDGLTWGQIAIIELRLQPEDDATASSP